MSKTARIFNIQYFSVHDGPGIRTTIFFKGCPLRCLWCHNPEGIASERHLSYAESKCIRCGACVQVCLQVHSITGGVHAVARENCTRRGLCVDACPTRALSWIGEDVTVDELVVKVVRDRKFYDQSGGGVTVSGGEPLLQADFVARLLRTLQAERIHTAVETSGFCGYQTLEKVLPYTSLFLYDYKETDEARHREYTGVSLKRITDNLRKLHDAGANILLRCPVIKGLNARAEHFEAIARLSNELPNLAGVELLPYHNLGVSKARHAGLAGQTEYEQVPREESDAWIEQVRKAGGKNIIVS